MICYIPTILYLCEEGYLEHIPKEYLKTLINDPESKLNFILLNLELIIKSIRRSKSNI